MNYDRNKIGASGMYILFSLASGDRHGWAILDDVRDLSGGRIELTIATLYGSLKRLLEQDMIEMIGEERAARGAQNRKVYRLTGLGRRVVDEEMALMENVQRSLAGRGLAQV